MDTDKKLANKIDKDKSKLAELTHDKPVFVPATDIYEKNESIFVVCDIPGVDEQDVDVSLENDVLTITAHQILEDLKDHDLIHEGYETGIYQRSFTVNNGVDREKIKAKLNNGVLSLELPKAESLKPKKITVNVQE